MKPISSFKFCPRCQKPIKKINERLIDCSFCGFHFYFAPSLTNAIILENEKKEILLVKRKIPPKNDFWDLPGGFVEFEETVEESTFREVKEEIGVSLKKISYLGSYIDKYQYRGLTYNTLCFVFFGKIKNEKIIVSDDAKEARFFSKNDLPWKKIAFLGIKKALKKIHR